MTDNRSRRDVLRTLGTASVGGLSLAAGCMGGETATDRMEDTSTTPETTPITVSAEPTPEQGTPGTETETPAADEPDAEKLPRGPAGYQPRFYAGYVPRQSFTTPRYHPGSISGDIRTARKHRGRFDGNFDKYRAIWDGWVPSSIPKESRFLLRHRMGGAIIGDFDKATAGEQLQAKNDAVEAEGENRGYDIYFDERLDLLIAVTDEEVLTVFSTNEQLGQKRLDHMLDVIERDGRSYYQFDAHYKAVVEQLPQGLYTRIFDGGALRKPGLPITAAGQSILITGETTKLRTVLKYPESETKAAPKTFKHVVNKRQLWNHQLNNAEVRTAGDRTVIVMSDIELATAFDE